MAGGGGLPADRFGRMIVGMLNGFKCSAWNKKKNSWDESQSERKEKFSVAMQ